MEEKRKEEIDERKERVMRRWRKEEELVRRGMAYLLLLVNAGE